MQLTRYCGAVQVEVDLLDELDVWIIIPSLDIIAVQNAQDDRTGQPAGTKSAVSQQKFAAKR